MFQALRYIVPAESHTEMQIAFSTLIVVQFLVVTMHDWLEIPGWTHGKQVQASVGRRKLLIATVANALFPGLAVAFLFLYRDEPKPGFVKSYWLIYAAVTVLSAVTMWYVPYFFGANEKTKQMYKTMYAGTKQVLPERGDNPRPNLLHLCFHALFLLTLVMALVVRLSAHM